MARQTITGLRVLGTIHDPATLRLIDRRPRVGDRVSMGGRLEPSGHAITISATYGDGAFRVSSVTVEAGEGGELTSGDLGLPVKEAAEQVLRAAWTFGETWLPEPRYATQTTAKAMLDEASERMDDFDQRQRRRWITDAHLRDVADAHADAERAGAQSVVRALMERFACSQSTAERWIRTARERGFLPPSQRQQRKA